MRHETLTPEFVENIPDDMQQGVIYVSFKYETAIHLCACGCGSQVVTPLGGSGWVMSAPADADGNKTVTLAPSIGNWQFPCKSHYFIRDNRVEWC